MKLFLKIILFIFTMMLFAVGELKSSTVVTILQKKISYVANNPLKFVDPTGMFIDWYLNLYKRQIERIPVSDDLFDQAKIRLADDDAKIEDIENALTEKGYDFEKDPSVEGGYFVDTREQYQAWKMMQVFSPGNLAAVFGMGGEFGVAKGAKAILPALGTGLAKSAKEGTKAVNNVAQQAKSWLGKDYKVVTNKAGDNIFMSKDRLRKMRFDIKNPHGDSPHIHLEEFINGKWRDAIPGTHRIYPQP